MQPTLFVVTLLAAAVAAAPQGTRVADLSDVTGTVCTDPGVELLDFDINRALLAICGSIAKEIQFCQGNPTETTGTFGASEFGIQAIEEGATINVSKGRWQACIRAARATCGNGPFTSTCIGGATEGNVAFSLSQV